MGQRLVSGWKPSHPDFRDFKFTPKQMKAEADLPQEVDLRPEFPTPYNQGNLGSCGPNSAAGLIERWYNVSKYPYPHTPSRLFIYWNTRVLMGTQLQDSGVDNRTMIQALQQFGECPESQPSGIVDPWYWTYSDNQIQFLLPPPANCVKDAKLHLVEKYEAVNLDRATVLNTLAQGEPFLFGFTVYSSFEGDQNNTTGVMPIPDPSEQMLGGHDVVCVGYILNKPMGTQGVKDWAIVRNSWGTAWGDKGYFYMPLDQVLCNSQMTEDAYAVTFVGHQ